MDDENVGPDKNQQTYNSAQQSPVPPPSVVENVTETTATTPENVPQKKRKLSKNVLLTAACLLTLTAASVLYFVVIKKPKNNQTTNSTVSSSTAQESSSAKPKEAQNIVTKSGNTFYGEIKKLPGMQVFKDYSYFGTSCDESGKSCKNMFTETSFNYYEIGKTSDNSSLIVMHASAAQTLDGERTFVLSKSADGKVAILAQHEHSLRQSLDPNNLCESCITEVQKSLANGVSIDRTTVIKELWFPTEATINGQKIKTEFSKDLIFLTGSLTAIRGSFFGDIDPKNPPVKIGETESYTFYKVNPKTTNTYQTTELYLTLGNIFSLPYKPNGELSSADENLPVVWKSGEQNTSKYFSGGPGCGGVGYASAVNVTTSDLVQVGTSKAGQKLYQLSSNAAPLLNELYNTDYNKGESLENTALKNLSLDQFTAKHGYFLVETALKEFQIFQRDDMFIRGGCGKPVVYLYPVTATSVSVKVGASVVKSEPKYEADGWQSVLAQPSGQLNYKGKNYGSLFWEGYGYGSYPDIVSGTVVRSSDAAATIKQQLKQQGLNDTEIADFIEYWQPKLPNTAYTRLTWFSTGALDRLAPLSIVPKPQTVIRTFLDFEGLDKPLPLKPQQFSAPERRGFTVVEWGGLLRGGIR